MKRQREVRSQILTIAVRKIEKIIRNKICTLKDIKILKQINEI